MAETKLPTRAEVRSTYKRGEGTALIVFLHHYEVFDDDGDFRDVLADVLDEAKYDARSTLARQLIEVVEAEQCQVAEPKYRIREGEEFNGCTLGEAYNDAIDDALSALRAKCKELGVEVVSLEPEENR